MGHVLASASGWPSAGPKRTRHLCRFGLPLEKERFDMTCYFFPVRLGREVARIQHVDLDVLEITGVWSRPRLAGTNARVAAKYRRGRNFGGEGCGIVARRTKRGTTAGKTGGSNK